MNALPWPLAFLILGVLAYRYATAALEGRIVKQSHVARLLEVEEQLDQRIYAIDTRLVQVEDKLRSEGRLASLGAAFGPRK